MTNLDEAKKKLAHAQEILQYTFKNEAILAAAITHPSATDTREIRLSYERLEFLGDSLLGAIIAVKSFHAYHDLQEGGLTRIKVSLVAGSSLSRVAEDLGFADVIVFGSSEAGTNRRGLHSALENVYEAVVAALFLDGGMDVAYQFVERTLIPHMNKDMAREPENPKSSLQERLQEIGITPTYQLIETQGPPHDRVFTSQAYAEDIPLSQGVGRTKKEAETQAAQHSLDKLDAYIELIKKSQHDNGKEE